MFFLCAHCFNMLSARVKRQQAKEWYAANKEDVCQAHHAGKSKGASKQVYENNPEKKREMYRKTYKMIQKSFLKSQKMFMLNNPEKFKEASKKAYADNPEKFKDASKKAYTNNLKKFKDASKKLTPIIQKNLKMLQRKLTPTIRKSRFKEFSKITYDANPGTKKETSKKAYKENSQKHKEAFKNNCCEYREEICNKKREEYVLCAPNESFVKSCVEGLLGEFMRNPEVKLKTVSYLDRILKS